MLTPADELRFWTGVMRDHGDFILKSLSYNEKDSILYSMYYYENFSKLHEKSKVIQVKFDTNELNILIKESNNLLMNFINFKRYLLGRLLQCQLNTSLPPTFYNHMLNEAMEFYKTLIYLQNNNEKDYQLENLNLHRIWLPDAAGHAASIAADLDPTEKLLIKEAQEFESCFNCLAIKSEELCKMYLRTGKTDCVLSYLNEEVKKKIIEFICFLEKIKLLRCECKILNVIHPAVPEHMIREENHYIKKIEAFETLA